MPNAGRMRVLVTGGTGFVGRAVVRLLTEAGHTVVVLTRTPPEHPQASVDFIQADLLTLTTQDATAIMGTVRPDVIVHCAGELSDLSRMAPLHLDATSVLARAAAGRVAHWIQISSVGALGSNRPGTVSPNDIGVKLIGEYEITKAGSDRLVLQAMEDSGTTVTVLMPTIIFGPGMRSDSLRRLFDVVRGGKFIHVGPREAGAHYIYIDDVAAAVVAAVRTRSQGRYVISDSTTVGSLVDALASEADTPSPRLRVPEWAIAALLAPRLSWLPIPGRASLLALRSKTFYSATPAASDLDWTPQIGWREGLKRTVTEWTGSPPPSAPPNPLKIVYLTTVPDTLHFFKGHISNEKSLGSKVTLVSDPSGDKLEKFGQEMEVATVGVTLSRELAPSTDLQSLLALFKILRRLRPDVLQTATPKAALLGALASMVTGIPLVVTGVFGLPQMNLRGWKRVLLDATTRISTFSTDVTWCDSQSMAKYVAQSRLAPRDHVVVLGQGSVAGVDAKKEFARHLFSKERLDIRSHLNIPDDAIVIGFVGRLAQDKGMTELARAWASIREQHQNAHLLLVGPEDGDLSYPSRQLLEAGDRQHWVGPQFPVAKWYSAMDIFVMPSYREGFCATNIEASAMQLPIVATRIPGCVDSVIDGETGTLVPARDSDALSRAITNYLEDPALAARHASAGALRARLSFIPEHLQGELSDLYRDALRRRELS